MFKKIALLSFIMILVSIDAQARKKKEKEIPVNHMALATMMVYDSNYEKAALELKQVDTNIKDFDFAKYHSISGIVAMKLEQYKEATKYFVEAIKQTKVKVYKAPVTASEEDDSFRIFDFIREWDKPKVVEKKVEKKKFEPEKLRAKQLAKLYLYKSEAHYKLKEYKETIETLDMAGEAGSNKAQLYTLRADCYWKLKEHSNAFMALNKGFVKFPKDTVLLKQKFYYFIDLGLYQKALEISSEYFAVITPQAKDYITFAQTMAGAGQLDKAIKVLENARLKFPKDAKLGVLLGHMYLKKNMPHTTADLFEKSSYYDHNYTHEAAEMHRRVNAIPHSLYLNSQINEKTEKLKQKIAIYIEREEFAKVIGLKKALFRYNMLEDENLRYAFAYAYFMLKDYTKAEHHLKKLTSSELFSKATMIRKNIEKCEDSKNKNSMECL